MKDEKGSVFKLTFEVIYSYEKLKKKITLFIQI